MSFKQALMQYKQQIEDNKVQEKIKEMLAQQQRILDMCEKPPVKIKKEVAKVDYSFNPEVLVHGGNTFYHTTINGVKRKFRISVTSDTHDVVLKFHTRISSGERFSVNAKSYFEAQFVTDELFSKLYRVSGTVV